MFRTFAVAVLGIALLATTSAATAGNLVASISGRWACTSVDSDQASQKAQLTLMRTGAGAQLLEIENERYKLRGPAVEVLDKESEHVHFFLDFGNTGSIEVEFFRDGRKLKGQLAVQRSARTVAQEGKPASSNYDCVKTK